MPACLLGAGARPQTLAGRRIAQARFEPSPCRRASGFAWPVVKSLLQPCEFRRPPRHESRICGTRTRLFRRLHEHGIDGYGLRSWIFVSGEARFVVARSANPICRHIWNSICGIAAMLTNRVFAHKSPGTPLCAISRSRRLQVAAFYGRISANAETDCHRYARFSVIAAGRVHLCRQDDVHPSPCFDGRLQTVFRVASAQVREVAYDIRLEGAFLRPARAFRRPRH